MTSRISATIVACAALALGAPMASAADSAAPAPFTAADPAMAASLPPDPAEAGVCRIDDPGQAVAIESAGQIAQLRALIAAEAEGAESAGFVPLNNRGYNYGAGAIVDPGVVRFEAERLAR
ncbi:MAG TPA: hypothetical protein VIN04_05835 [Myxococcota bacterium]